MASPDSVSFVGVLKNYPPGEKLEVSYSLHESMTPASRDWVGLFRVGWSSSRDYYTFEWVPASSEKKGTVLFAGRRLPPEDKHFYQFCYVSSDGRVRGASSPFQFTSSASGDRLEDLELVEVSEDSLMILQPKDVVVEPTKSAIEAELISVKESFVKLEAEKEVLVGQYKQDSEEKSKELGEMEEKVQTMEEKVEEMEEKVVDLERQLQAKRESEDRLMEKLEKERASNHELAAEKSNEASQVRLLREQMAEMEAALAAKQEDNEMLAQKVAELETHVQELESSNRKLTEGAEESQEQLDQLREVQVELMAQIGEKNSDLEQSEMRMAEVKEHFAEEYRKACEERDHLQQEIVVAQQNIAELAGARREGVEVNIHANCDPPTLPATQVAMVDKSAYEALQQAYENIEQMYYKSSEENRELRSRLHDRKVRHDESQREVAELKHRVEKCLQEYQAKCKELHDAQKQSVFTGVGGNVAMLQAKLQEMENQEQVTQSLAEAVQELATRKAELKQKTVQVAEAEEKIQSLEAALCGMQEEFREFQEKHDHVSHDKTARMDELVDNVKVQATKIESLEEALCAKEQELQEVREKQEQVVREAVAPVAKEKGKLEGTLKHLREQLNTLKQQAKASDRTCPVCNTKFPGRISQKDFEKHVEGHFQR